MTNFTKLAAALTGLAAIAAVSAPAAAQINPYGQVDPYGTPYGRSAPEPYTTNGGVLGAIVSAVTGYGQYPQGNYGYEQTAQRGAVEMCARSAEQRLNSDQRYNGYGNTFGQRGHNGAYAQSNNGRMFRVVGITDVQRTSNGALKVRGIASSDIGHGNTSWNQPRVDDQRHAGYNDSNDARNGYANNGYRAAGMDYRFTCKIDWRGAVTSLNFDHGTISARG